MSSPPLPAPGTPRRRPARRALAALLLPCLLAPVWGQSGEAQLSDAARRRLERERVRQAVEGAYQKIFLPAKNFDERQENVAAAAEGLAELGETALPFLLNELEAENRNTFTFVAYALGRVGHPDAIPSLEAAVERAEQDLSGFGAARKAWALWALAWLGDDDAVRKLDEGNHPAGHEALFYRTEVGPVVAAITAPGSYEHIHAMIADYEPNPAEPDKRIRWVKGLRYAPSPENLDKLVAYLDDPSIAFRRETVRAIVAIEDPRVTDVLLGVLRSEADNSVRYHAAAGLLEKRIVIDPDVLFELLKTEASSYVRGQLYRLVALSGRRQVRRLARLWGLPDSQDRFELVEALGMMQTATAVPHLERALDDEAPQVRIGALMALDRIGTKRSLELLRKTAAGDHWIAARNAFELLVARRDEATAPIVEEVLFERRLRNTILDPTIREEAHFLLEWLVDLEVTGAVDRFADARKVQKDGELLVRLDRAERRLRAARKADQEPRGWFALAEGEDEDLRDMARRHLARSNEPDALAWLGASLETASYDQVAVWLSDLAPVDSPGLWSILEPLLLSERFDAAAAVELRSHAAWLASRTGSPRAADVLTESVDRREGRDCFPLAYLAVTDRELGRERIERHRISRFQYLYWARGSETDLLNWVLGQIRSNRPLALLQSPPREIDLRGRV